LFPHVNEGEANKLAFETIGKTGLKNLVKNVVIAMTVVATPVVAFWWCR